jgi:serine/threonine protein kinase
VSHCLKINPKERYNADQILSHEWFCGQASNVPQPQIAEQLRQFNAKRRFRRVANVAVATNKFMAFAREAKEKRSEDTN